VKRDLLIVTCAVSAGVHAALVHEHLDESAAAGGGFMAATVLLGALIVGLTLRPDNHMLVIGAALTFIGLVVSYGLATTTGMPVLMPNPEPVEGLALATKAVEVLGLAVAWSLVRRDEGAPFHSPQREGAST
jgi:hypothetical protein